MVLGVVVFLLGVEAFEHDVAGDAVAVVGGLGALEVAAGGFAECCAGVVSVG